VARWRVIPHSRAGAGAQLARSEALWQDVAGGAAPPTLRWYGYAAPAVVLGVGQSPELVDAAAARAAGYAVVRRTSGGTAVLADETMLALDVALPAAHPRAGTDVVAAYRWVGDAFRETLAALAPGAAVRLRLAGLDEARRDQAAARDAAAGSAEALRALACFGTLSPWEVVLDAPGAAPGEGATARKLVGLSQVRKRSVVLFQAGLYTTVRVPPLVALLRLGDAERARLAATLPARIAGLDDAGLTESHLDALRQGVQARLLAATDGGALSDRSG
jgi:lipoate-protein ligase A